MPIRLTQVAGFALGMTLRVSDYPRVQLVFQHVFPDETACSRHLERILAACAARVETLTCAGTFTKMRRRVRIPRNQTSLC